MARKTIEYKGEFKVNLNFAMTSGEGIDDATVEAVVKMMSKEMYVDVKEAVECYFGDEDDIIKYLEVTCEEIDHVINVADNTSEVEMISEELKTESGEE